MRRRQANWRRLGHGELLLRRRNTGAAGQRRAQPVQRIDIAPRPLRPLRRARRLLRLALELIEIGRLAGALRRCRLSRIGGAAGR